MMVPLFSRWEECRACKSTIFSEYLTLLERAIVVAFLSIRPSVCQVHGLWQNKRNLCWHFYTTWKTIHPSFLRRRMVAGVTPSTWNFWANWPRWSENTHFQSIFACSASASASNLAYVGSYASVIGFNSRWLKALQRTLLSVWNLFFLCNCQQAQQWAGSHNHLVPIFHPAGWLVVSRSFIIPLVSVFSKSVTVGLFQIFSSIKWFRPDGSEVGVEGTGVAEVRSGWPRSSRDVLSTLYRRWVRPVDGKYHARDSEVIAENKKK